MTFYDRLIPIETFDLPGINRAFVESHKSILLGSMSRREVADVAAYTGSLRALPPGHLLDHRLRGTLLPPLADAKPDEVVRGDDWSESIPVLTEWLGHHLDASDRPGAHGLVSRALQLDPKIDAELLVQVGAVHHGFFRSCSHGRLGMALRTVMRDDFSAELREPALHLVGRLLMYFCCFSIQLVAARAW